MRTAEKEPSGLVMNLQHYSTKDGPGIRTTAFLVGCNLRCLWCSNPENMYPGAKVMRHDNLCQRCGACVATGSNGSVWMADDGVHINRNRCDNIFDLPSVCNCSAYDVSGEVMTASELARRLLRDDAFYFTSGGGVTFSGGECLMQPEFVARTAEILHGHNVHVAFDTAGLWDIDRVSSAIEQADLVLYDIKAFDPGIHRACTGVGNALILRNAQTIAERGISMMVRMVVVPGINDDAGDLRARLDFVASLGSAVKQVDLLKYHKLGAGKYKSLDLPYPLPNVREATDDDLADALNYGSELGLKMTVGG